MGPHCPLRLCTISVYTVRCTVQFASSPKLWLAWLAPQARLNNCRRLGQSTWSASQGMDGYLVSLHPANHAHRPYRSAEKCTFALSRQESSPKRPFSLRHKPSALQTQAFACCQAQLGQGRAAAPFLHPGPLRLISVSLHCLLLFFVFPRHNNIHLPRLPAAILLRPFLPWLIPIHPLSPRACVRTTFSH